MWWDPLSSSQPSTAPLPVYDRDHHRLGTVRSGYPGTADDRSSLEIALEPDTRSVLGIDRRTVAVPLRRVEAVRRDEVRLDATLAGFRAVVEGPLTASSPDT